MVDPECRPALLSPVPFRGPRGSGESAHSPVETMPCTRSWKLTGQESHVGQSYAMSLLPWGTVAASAPEPKKIHFFHIIVLNPLLFGFTIYFPNLYWFQSFYFENSIA